MYMPRDTNIYVCVGVCACVISEIKHPFLGFLLAHYSLITYIAVVFLDFFHVGLFLKYPIGWWFTLRGGVN